MKIMECPNCKEQVLMLWELFVFPSSFWLTKSCRNCQKKMQFNFGVVYLVIILFFVAMILRLLVDKIVSFESILFDAFIYLSCISIPFFQGKKLFILKKEKSEEGSDERRDDSGN
jgi:hypothetical protein